MKKDLFLFDDKKPIIDCLRPIKKVRGNWVEIKGKNGIFWTETPKIKRIKNEKRI